MRKKRKEAMKKVRNMAVLALSAAMGIYILCRGGSLILTKNGAGAPSDFVEQLDMLVNEGSVSMHMPALKYPLEGTKTGGIESWILKKAMNLFPIINYVEAKSDDGTDIENSSTYKKILAKEASDENAVDENGKLITSEENLENMKKENAGTTDQAQESKPVVQLSMDKLRDFDYLRNNFYVVDQTTTITSDELNVDTLLGKDMSLSEGEGPKILIYHTHSQEEFADSTPGDPATSIVGVGDRLASILKDKYGYEVLHHKGIYDMVNGKLDRNQAYYLAGKGIEKVLKENPSIEVVIDLHRDGVAESTRLVTDVNGKPTAQFMFFNGLSRTTKTGNIDYLPNPYIQDNLALSLQMELKAAEYYPGVSRKIYLKGYRYNLHMKPKSLLIEAGAQTNTVEEEMNAMEPLADVLDKVLKKK